MTYSVGLATVVTTSPYALLLRALSLVLSAGAFTEGGRTFA
jgi:hypothetical protein